MTHQQAEKLASELLALFAVLQCVATLAVDLNRTHATNPEWPAHARFHLVWQNVSVAVLTAITEYVLWNQNIAERTRFHLAIWMTAAPLFGFLAALFSRSFYGGSTFDQSGILPLTMRIRGARKEIDLNTVAVLSGFAVLVFVRWLHDLR